MELSGGGGGGGGASLDEVDTNHQTLDFSLQSEKL